MRLSSGLLALAVVMAIGCARKLEPSLVADTLVEVRTEDGWVLPMRHYQGDGDVVLLMHGMAANHTNWDFRPEVSPVDELVEQGYDVWIPSLRGDPGTLPPQDRGARRIDFDDHALRDVPAVLDVVHAATRQDDLLWDGHSMGGMLLYTTLVTRPESVRAGVAIASPATFQNPIGNHKAMRTLGFMTGGRRGRLPLRGMARTFAGFRPLVRQLGNPDQLDKGIVRGMAAHTLNNLPRATAHQARLWLKERELCRTDGSPWLDSAPQVEVPLLVFGSPDDHIASERDVAHACEIFPDCRYVLLSKEQGFAGDYGHIDPVVGTTAHVDVYPLVFEYLREHASP